LLSIVRGGSSISHPFDADCVYFVPAFLVLPATPMA